MDDACNYGEIRQLLMDLNEKVAIQNGRIGKLEQRETQGVYIPKKWFSGKRIAFAFALFGGGFAAVNQGIELLRNLS